MEIKFILGTSLCPKKSLRHFHQRRRKIYFTNIFSENKKIKLLLFPVASLFAGNSVSSQLLATTKMLLLAAIGCCYCEDNKCRKAIITVATRKCNEQEIKNEEITLFILALNNGAYN